MKLTAAQASALARALHMVEGAASRWSAEPRLDDEQLMGRISSEFGIYGGFWLDEAKAEYKGGANPQIKIETEGTSLVLRGADLIDAVREVLGIGRSGELF